MFSTRWPRRCNVSYLADTDKLHRAKQPATPLGVLPPTLAEMGLLRPQVEAGPAPAQPGYGGPPAEGQAARRLDQLTGLATLETDRLRIIQRAEYHRACMQGLSREAMLDYLEGVFEACLIVTGVFPRADELVIVFLKGGGDLLQAAAAGRCFPIGPLEAVPCVGEEQALLFGHLFGSPCPSGYPVFQKMPTVH